MRDAAGRDTKMVENAKALDREGLLTFLRLVLTMDDSTVLRTFVWQVQVHGDRVKAVLSFDDEKRRANRCGAGSPGCLLAPRVGFEPTTTRLTVEGSAVELPRNMSVSRRKTVV